MVELGICAQKGGEARQTIRSNSLTIVEFKFLFRMASIKPKDVVGDGSKLSEGELHAISKFQQNLKWLATR